MNQDNLNMNRYKFDDKEHLHTLDGKPLIGTTTSLKVLNKPLTWWASGKAVELLGWSPIRDPLTKKPVDRAIRLPIAEKKLEEVKLLDADSYLKLLDKAYGNHNASLDKSATKGTDMHSDLERYVKKCILFNEICEPLEEYSKPVTALANWARENVKKFLVSEEFCYSERLWIGGGFDCLYEDMSGRNVILDFKSSKEAYSSHFLQNALYDIQISENGVVDKDGNLLLKVGEIGYYGVFPFGAEEPKPEFWYDTESARQDAEAVIRLAKSNLINK